MNMDARSVVEVADLPKTFSFSRFMDGREQEEGSLAGAVDIVRDGKPLDVVYCITLGLNEEGHKLKQGSFYHLPLRQDINHGHPCDIVFIDEEWEESDCETWEDMNWEERIDLCAADDKIQGSERVIPICARVLDLGQSSTSSTGRTVSSDPATRRHNFAYSRPIEDLSSMSIIFKNLGSLSLICRTRAAEHQSMCTRFPTPGDVSETFILSMFKEHITNHDGQPKPSEDSLRARRHVFAGSHAGSMQDAVRILIARWHVTAREDMWRFGPLHYTWSELETRISTPIENRHLLDMEFWPKEFPADIEI